MILCSFSHAQQQQPQEALEVPQDSTYNIVTYGLRIGLDIASPLRTALDDDYTGFQLLADYRLTDRWYVAGEIGTESIDRTSAAVDFETDGSFIKAGADFNLYRNWVNMDNMIYAGFRTGFSTFSQQLDRFDINQDNNYFPIDSIEAQQEFNNLTAFWIELQVGVKVELIDNLYMVANVQLKRLVNEDQPDGFDNLFVPGFGRTFDTNEIGVGYTYGIQYRIPFFKK
ncbi:DUF6048 family protein [Nonlabens ponticola]|nr:DUF6048 family protein [Nonlabens ponticola]